MEARDGRPDQSGADRRRGVNRRWRAGALCLLAALLGSSAFHGGQAADPQPYSVTIAPTGQAAMDQAVHDAATLVSLRDSAAVGPFALVARARADVQRFEAVLQSYGYYDGQVRVTIAGRPLDDPDLPGALEATADGRAVPVAVSLALGPMFRIGQIALAGDLPEAARDALPLKPGAPALAADVLAARDKLLATLRGSGHALAKVADPVATVRPATHELDISMQVDAGPRVNLGPIAITGLQRTNEDFVRGRLLLHEDEPFDPAAIEAARQDLASVSAFSSVRIDAAEALDAAGTLPMTVQITERKLRSISFGAAYSTDLGGSVSASWTHRNLFGNGEQLTLSAAATELGGTAALQPGYKLTADLAIPDWQRRDQTLSFNLTAVDESLEAYDRRAVLGGATLERKLSHDITASVGLEMEQAHIVQEDVGYNYTLLQVPGELRYDNTNSLFDPVHGMRAKLSVTPTESLGSPGSTFVIAQASASTYLDVGKPLFGTTGRSVVAVRGLVGGVEGAMTFDIPPDQRFYAGGGGTVRGFRFQTIGPEFSENNPKGGTSVDVGSVEFRQRFGESYGAVAFVDAGQVGTSGVPFQGDVRVGAGIGARYYTSFGPIRLDVAVPINKAPGGDAFELYLGIGQAF